MTAVGCKQFLPPPKGRYADVCRPPAIRSYPRICNNCAMTCFTHPRQLIINNQLIIVVAYEQRGSAKIGNRDAARFI